MRGEGDSADREAERPEVIRHSGGGTPSPGQGHELAASSAVPLAPAGSANASAGGQATNVQVNVAAPNVIVVQSRSGESILIRAVWFIFLGWWIGYIWATAAWFLNLTIIGLPLGILMLNRLPAVVTLRRSERKLAATTQAGQIVVAETGPEQQPWWVRGIYFVLVGWWLSLVWINLAYLFMVTIIGLPLAFIMFDYIAAITTLRRLK